MIRTARLVARWFMRIAPHIHLRTRPGGACMQPTSLRPLVLMAAMLWLPMTAFAQEAALSGTVTDSTGGVLPGVVVRAVLEDTGNSFEAVTDSAGAYRLVVRI